MKPYTASRWTDGCMGGNSGTIYKRMQTRDITLLAMNEMFRIYVRAYIRKKYPQKVFTHSQRVSKRLKFSALRCEGLGFSSLHTPHRPFTPAMAVKRRWFNIIFVLRQIWGVQWVREAAGSLVWNIEGANIHTDFLWKSERKEHDMKEWMFFSGNKTRIYTRAKSRHSGFTNWWRSWLILPSSNVNEKDYGFDWFYWWTTPKLKT